MPMTPSFRNAILFALTEVMSFVTPLFTYSKNGAILLLHDICRKDFAGTNNTGCHTSVIDRVMFRFRIPAYFVVYT